MSPSIEEKLLAKAESARIEREALEVVEKRKAEELAKQPQHVQSIKNINLKDLEARIRALEEKA